MNETHAEILCNLLNFKINIFELRHFCYILYSIVICLFGAVGCQIVSIMFQIYFAILFHSFGFLLHETQFLCYNF